MSLPERSPERDTAIDALLSRVPFEGWSPSALRGALSDIGVDPADGTMLFPGGAADLVEAYCDLGDRRMVEAAEEFTELRTSQRVRAVVALRLRQHRPHREAVRRALAVLARPGHAVLAIRCTARTMDAMWHAAGDRSADFSWYTKRGILAGVYGATLLRWLVDTSEDDADTLAFLDRRLAGAVRLGRLRRSRMA